MGDGVNDLSLTVGGRDDPHGAASVEEVQDFVEHLRRFDREDHARRPFHPRPFFTERARDAQRYRSRKLQGVAGADEPRRREERYRRAGALLIPRPTHLAFLSGDVRVRSVTPTRRLRTQRLGTNRGPGRSPGPQEG